MAHVLVVDGDGGIRAAMRELLVDAGHCVMTTSDPTLAQAILMVCERPLVVFVNDLYCTSHSAAHSHPSEPLTSRWQMSAPGSATATISTRHHFIVMTSTATGLAYSRRRLLIGLPVHSFRQPFDNAEVLSLIAECDIGSEAPHAGYQELLEARHEQCPWR